jgi:hypothetical protein
MRDAGPDVDVSLMIDGTSCSSSEIASATERVKQDSPRAPFDQPANRPISATCATPPTHGDDDDDDDDDDASSEAALANRLQVGRGGVRLPAFVASATLSSSVFTHRLLSNGGRFVVSADPTPLPPRRCQE